jgi:hypothetical protein
VTFDCWGTLFLDGPAADESYKRQRLAGMEAVLGARGSPSRRVLSTGPMPWRAAPRAALGDEPRTSTWRPRDGRARASIPALPSRLPAGALDELIDAYACPVLRVPPAADGGAPAALAALARRGLALAVVSIPCGRRVGC